MPQQTIDIEKKVTNFGRKNIPFRLKIELTHPDLFLLTNLGFILYGYLAYRCEKIHHVKTLWPYPGEIGWPFHKWEQ